MPESHGVPPRQEPDPVRWEAPIFVVSSGRSGSTHLANILANHPEVAITHESNIAHFLSLTHSFSYLPLYQVREVAGFRGTGLIPEIYAENFAEVLLDGMLEAWRRFYRRQFADRRFTRWGDKFQFPEVVPDLIRLFPEARFVHVVRDGRDSARSAVLHLDRYRREQNADAPPMSFREHCDYWTRINRQLMEFLRSARAVLTMRYEDLVLDEQESVSRLLGFLDLPDHEGVWSFLRTRSQDSFQSHGTSRDPAASLGRWEHELSDEEKRIAHETQGDLLAELGYRTR